MVNSPSQNPDNHDNPPLSNKVVIATLLNEGYHAAQIAKRLGISRQAVAKHIKKYVRAGVFKAISQNPAHFVKVIHDNPPEYPFQSQSPMTTQISPTILPHHYGGLFALVGRPPLPYNSKGKAHDFKKAGWTAQFGRYKAQIWLKSFTGTSPKEIRENAYNALLDRANEFEQRYQITLTLIKIYTNIEWAMTSNETSEKIANSLGLAKNEEILIDNVRHKNGDASHDTMEFIPTSLNPAGASKHADAHHFVYSGELAKTLEAIGNAIISINQKLI